MHNCNHNKMVTLRAAEIQSSGRRTWYLFFFVMYYANLYEKVARNKNTPERNLMKSEAI